MSPFTLSFVTTFFGLWIAVPVVFGFMRFFGFYTIVHEGTSKVFVLFGNVLETITEPGIHFLWFKLGPSALIVNWIGTCWARVRTCGPTRSWALIPAPWMEPKASVSPSGRPTPGP